MNTLKTLTQMMVEQFDLKAEDLKPDTALDSLGIDSLSVIDFMWSIEDKFHIQLLDEQVELKTLQDIATALDHLIATQGAKEPGTPA